MVDKLKLTSILIATSHHQRKEHLVTSEYATIKFGRDRGSVVKIIKETETQIIGKREYLDPDDIQVYHTHDLDFKIREDHERKTVYNIMTYISTHSKDGKLKLHIPEFGSIKVDDVRHHPGNEKMDISFRRKNEIVYRIDVKKNDNLGFGFSPSEDPLTIVILAKMLFHMFSTGEYFYHDQNRKIDVSRKKFLLPDSAAFDEWVRDILFGKKTKKLIFDDNNIHSIVIANDIYISEIDGKHTLTLSQKKGKTYQSKIMHYNTPKIENPIILIKSAKDSMLFAPSKEKSLHILKELLDNEIVYDMMTKVAARTHLIFGASNTVDFPT